MIRRRSLLQPVLASAACAATSGGNLAQAQAKAKAGMRKREFIEADDGTSLFYKDWGTGKPMVFVAAFALNSDFWEYQMTYLSSQGVRCIAYDRRGHGRSGQPGHGYDFDTLADDLAAVLKQLDLRDVTLVGHSMGCGEIVRYLSRHGSSRIARIVLVATITPFSLKTADNPEGADRSVFEKGRADLYKDRPRQIAQAAPGFFGAPKNPVSTEMMDWWTRMLLQCSLKAMLDLHRMFTETDFRAELRKIKAPTLVIHGDSDTSTPIDRTGRRTARLISGSQFKVYEGAAHGLLVTHMDRLNADLLAFAKS